MKKGKHMPASNVLLEDMDWFDWPEAAKRTRLEKIFAKHALYTIHDLMAVFDIPINREAAFRNDLSALGYRFSKDEQPQSKAGAETLVAIHEYHRKESQIMRRRPDQPVNTGSPARVTTGNPPDCFTPTKPVLAATEKSQCNHRDGPHRCAFRAVREGFCANHAPTA